jgi:hypothetical protein
MLVRWPEMLSTCRRLRISIEWCLGKTLLCLGVCIIRKLWHRNIGYSIILLLFFEAFIPLDFCVHLICLAAEGISIKCSGFFNPTDSFWSALAQTPPTSA